MRRYDYDLNATEYHVALLESSFVHLWNVIMAVVTHYGSTLSSTNVRFTTMVFWEGKAVGG